MNPYKKIKKLESKVADLERENDNLRFCMKDLKRMQTECDLKCKAADAKELEYQKLIEELRKERELYDKLIHSMRFAIHKSKGACKKAIKEIKRDLDL